MSWKATYRAIQAAERRQQRDAQRRLRELERQAKEQAKLSAIEQARLEVERFENQLEVLLSVHKEHGETWDWTAIAASLPPPKPQKISRHEYQVRQRVTVLPTQQKETMENFSALAFLSPLAHFAAQELTNRKERIKNYGTRITAPALSQGSLGTAH
jgi:hypothetical protein